MDFAFIFSSLIIFTLNNVILIYTIFHLAHEIIQGIYFNLQTAAAAGTTVNVNATTTTTSTTNNDDDTNNNVYIYIYI